MVPFQSGTYYFRAGLYPEHLLSHSRDAWHCYERFEQAFGSWSVVTQSEREELPRIAVRMKWCLESEAPT